MTEDINPDDDDTKDLSEKLSDRQILLELRYAVAGLAERMTALEHRTNPLPSNYDERFAALEAEVSATRRDIGLLREDIFNERRARADLAARVDALESRPS